MNYQQTVEYLFESLPFYQNIGAGAYKANLDNSLKLMEITKYPFKNFRTIHVAGTNGKGSISHLLASIFQEMGFKTALFTSPHLKDFKERFRINGTVISENYVVEFVKKYKKDFDTIKPSFFEMSVALAFDYFNFRKADIAIIETGLGGRLDSTNVINPILSIITNIGLDHIQFLGNNLKDIAKEKAGIIKPNTPIVIGESNFETDKVFFDAAQKNNSDIYFASQIYSSKILKNNNSEIIVEIFNNTNKILLDCPLSGIYQEKNLKTLIASIDVLNKNYNYNISENILQKGVKNVIKNTNFLGRWQIINKMPLAICDTAHNIDGLKIVCEQINTLKFKSLKFVLGMVDDKDIKGILEILPKKAQYYFCKANIRRALNEQALKELASTFGLNGNCYNSVQEAYSSAIEDAEKDDLVFVGGSNFVVAEAI